jgi:hypothetical protein
MRVEKIASISAIYTKYYLRSEETQVYVARMGEMR